MPSELFHWQVRYIDIYLWLLLLLYGHYTRQPVLTVWWITALVEAITTLGVVREVALVWEIPLGGVEVAGWFAVGMTSSVVARRPWDVRHFHISTRQLTRLTTNKHSNCKHSVHRESQDFHNSFTGWFSSKFAPYTHTHPRLTALYLGLPGWAGTRNVKPVWIKMRQEMMGFWYGSGIIRTICKQSAPCSREITTPTPHHSIFTGRMLFLMPNQQCQNTEGNYRPINWNEKQLTIHTEGWDCIWWGSTNVHKCQSIIRIIYNKLSKT